MKEDSSFRTKKISQKFPKSQNKTRHFTPPQKSTSAYNTINSNNTHTNSHNLQTNTINPTTRNQAPGTKNPFNYKILKNLIDEMEHLKEVCKDLKKTQEENCLLHNEKTIFEKIKNEHIKLNADMSIIKDDIKEILGNYHNLMKRVVALEEENKNLRAHNKNLVRNMQNLNNGWVENNSNNNYNPTNNNNSRLENNTKHESNEVKNIPASYGKYRTNNKNYGGDKYHNNSNFIEYNSNTPQKSKNSKINEMPIPSNNEDVYRNISGGHNHLQSYTMISDISAFNNNQNQSSLEMNLNINNNLERTAMKRRFLIPKN